MVTMTTARRCFLLDNDALLFMSAACRWELRRSLHVDNVSADAIFTGILHDTDHLSFFLEYMYKGISMFFVRPPIQGKTMIWNL